MSDRLIEKLPTAIPGLDTILHGGLPRGGIYIVQGTPGSGKTILGNQLCFHHAARGGQALYVTLLAESHARMLLHIGQLDFFVGRKVHSDAFDARYELDRVTVFRGGERCEHPGAGHARPSGT